MAVFPSVDIFCVSESLFGTGRASSIACAFFLLPCKYPRMSFLRCEGSGCDGCKCEICSHFVVSVASVAVVASVACVVIVMSVVSVAPVAIVAFVLGIHCDHAHHAHHRDDAYNYYKSPTIILRTITKSGAESPFFGIGNPLIIDFHLQMWCNLLRKEVQNHFFS